MRHGNTINHLGRKYAHRKALLANLANDLILHKRIITTLAKAKELRKFIEPLVTKSKENTTHQRRVVFSYLTNKITAKELFDTVAPKVGDRQGGYTRILRAGFRAGDNAEMAYIEFVDFNETYTNSDAAKAGKKRTRRAGKAKKEETAAVAAPVVEDTTIEEVVAETPAVDTTEETKPE
jgi:large subunit ribosomal protein L17